MKRFLAVLAIILACPWPALAESNFFTARVEEVLAEQQALRENGTAYVQQNVKLRGMDGEWKGREIFYYGIGEMEVVGAVQVRTGDKVRVSSLIREDGQVEFYIVEHVRLGYLYALAIVFALLVVIVGKKRGVGALLSLVLSFTIIMYFIIPQILRGRSPLVISISGALVILGLVIYVTWGWRKKAHLAFIALFFSLLFTGLFSSLIVKLTRLSGASGEEILSLVQSGAGVVNFQGLLLAGIIIGALGVLDDVVVSQVSTVEQLIATDSDLSFGEIYRRAMTVGVDHISSMVNTLFLAYAGAALPLLLLFGLKQEPFLTFTQVLNNEAIAAEVVRTFAGSMGLILAVPLSTILAAKYLSNAKNK